MLETEDLDDLLSDEAISSPATYYRKLRERDPVYWNKRWNGWIVTSYDEVTAGYRDNKRLSSDRFSGPFGAEVRQAGEGTALLEFLSHMFFFKDPPYHTRMRSLVFKAFTPRSVEIVRERARNLVRDLVEPLRGKDEVEFLTDFAFHLPVIVIAEYLGVPSDRRYEVRDWSDDLAAVIFVSGDDENRMQRAEQALHRAHEFLSPVIAERRANPREDLISALIFAEHEGQRLSEEEVIANIILMVFAGHETTMNLLSNSIVAFDSFPDQWQLLREDPSLMRSTIEECLRFDGPIRGLGRWATEDFEFGGHAIKRMDRVLLVQHAANRDPKAFDDPDRLDISRWPNKHAAFGQGIHTCLGAPLARLEMQEALRFLSQEFSRIEVVQDDLRYNRTMVSRSLKGLKVKFHDA
ncbi:cytochrome P450 [Sphingobium aquiterrae]|uniref:cytochrome P450 n=1 Tax=Sphingobium aquiterrae TaxID=2038656 RepID=UPI0030168F1D